MSFDEGADFEACVGVFMRVQSFYEGAFKLNLLTHVIVIENYIFLERGKPQECVGVFVRVQSFVKEAYIEACVGVESNLFLID